VSEEWKPSRDESLARALAAARVYRGFGSYANDNERVIVLLAEEVEHLRWELAQQRKEKT